MILRSHKTKIVATIGPASDSPETLVRMINAGMDIARLNFSHGDFDVHARRIDMLRMCAQETCREIAILADLPGPKMRIGQLANEPIELRPGGRFTLTADPIVGDATRVSTSFPELPNVVKPEDMLFLNDGLIQLQVVEVKGVEVRCEVVAGGELRSRKGLNLPGIKLGISAFTEHDRKCLAFAIKHGVDAVSQSFVESAADIEAVRHAANELGGKPFLIAKIERAGALDHVDEILAVADGMMVARGDLGVEVPIERIAILQKTLLRKAVAMAKPVITATQMLESMTGSPQPTRAEATDVANAILDGTDCVMLSAESAMGKFPVEAIATLARIAVATEPHRDRRASWDRRKPAVPGEAPNIPDLLSWSVKSMIDGALPAAVVVPTRTGTTARSIARLRLPIWTVAASPTTVRSLLFSYGVQPIQAQAPDDNWDQFAREWILAQKLPGRFAILIQGASLVDHRGNHRLELIEIA